MKKVVVYWIEFLIKVKKFWKFHWHFWSFKEKFENFRKFNEKINKYLNFLLISRVTAGLGVGCSHFPAFWKFSVVSGGGCSACSLRPTSSWLRHCCIVRALLIHTNANTTMRAKINLKITTNILDFYKIIIDKLKIFLNFTSTFSSLCANFKFILNLKVFLKIETFLYCLF